MALGAAAGLLLTFAACSSGEGQPQLPGAGATTGAPLDCGGGCASGQSCQNGNCVCQPGLSDCAGVCADLSSDASHCGSCDNGCGAQLCSSGTCQHSCEAGQTACGQSCVDLISDVSHCGQCGVACALGETCSQGVCQAGNGGVTTTTSTGATTDSSGTSGASMGDTSGTGAGGNANASTTGSGLGGSSATNDTTSADTTGTNTSTSTSTTGGMSDCGVQSVNPNASDAAQRVLCYLYEIYGNSVLSGQQDCHWSESSDLDYINSRTGEYPAIVGGDFLYDNAVDQAIASWNAGGLSMIRYHMGRPEDADSYESSLGTTDLADTLTPGTNRHSGLMAKFEHAASELQRLEDAGVVVLWAPFHESQPDGWFWWSKGSGAQLRQLWQLMFDDFTARGLDNILWLMPFSGEPDGSFYPGKEYVDLAGPDTYGSGQPFASMYQDTVGVVGNTIPIPLHETGTIPNPGDMFNDSQAPWVLFNVWCEEFLRDNSDGALQTAYSHARTINRGGLPNFD